jgi:hypothetical protein
MAKKKSQKSRSKQVATTRHKTKNGKAKLAQPKTADSFITNFEGLKSGKQKTFLANLKTLSARYV